MNGSERRGHSSPSGTNALRRSHSSPSASCSVATSRRRSVHDDYTVLGLLGTGASATVYRAVCRGTGEQVAVKVLPTRYSDTEVACVRAEHMLNERVSRVAKCREYVVPLADASVLDDGNNNSCMIFKLMTGGSLADLGLSQQVEISEADAKRAMFNVFSALAALHKNGIAHCDVKLANILLETRGDFSTARLADLGLSQDFRERKAFRPPAGTPSSFPPEMVRVYVNGDTCGYSYGKEVDLWAAGVMLCELLAGKKPFDGTTITRVFAQICSAPVSLNTGRWEKLGVNAKDLAYRCLDRDRKTRITAKQAVAHPWFDDVREERRGKRSKTASWLQSRLSCVTGGLERRASVF